MIRFITLAVGLLLIALATPAHGAIELFLKIDDIAGDSTDSKHPDWIVLSSYEAGVETPPATGGSGESRPEFSPFTFVGPTSKASPEIFGAVVTGKVFPTITLDIVNATGNNNPIVAQWELGDASLTSYKADGSAATSLLTDQYTAVFRSVKYTYFPVDQNGAAGTPVTFIWGVPEPSTIALLVMGCATLLRRRRC